MEPEKRPQFQKLSPEEIESVSRRGGQFARMPGGRYEARQDDDGTWTVLGIPIFTTVKKGVKQATRDITAADLRMAVDIHNRKFNEGYVAQCNVLHNYGLFKAQRAGFFLPREVRTDRFNGQLRPIIFADLLNVPNKVFLAMDRGDLPYCSVEVKSYEPLQFGALALLDTEPPFFEFPMITFATKEYAKAFEHAGEGTVALAHFRLFEEDAMADDAPEKKDDEKPEAEMQAGEDGGIKDAIKAIEAKMKEIQPLLELLPKLQEMLAAPMAGGEAGEEGPVDEPVTAMSAGQAKLLGRVSALEMELDANRKEREKQALFSGVVAQLEKDGYSLPDSVRARFLEMAGHGKKVFSAFVDSYRETAQPDPSFEMVGAASGEHFPAEVMTFSHQGPEKFAAAQKAYREWTTFPDDKFRSPLDRYLKREVG